MYLDFSEYDFEADIYDHPRFELIHERSFSPAERSRGLVKLSDPVIDAPILDSYNFAFHREDVLSASTKAFIGWVRDIYLGPCGLLLDPDQKQGYYYSPIPSLPSGEYTVVGVEQVFPLTFTRWGYSWQHFMGDSLDILVFAQEILNQNPQVPILVEKPGFKHFGAILRNHLRLTNQTMVPDKKLLCANWKQNEPQAQVFFKVKKLLYAQFYPVNNGSDVVPQMAREIRSHFIDRDLDISLRNKVVFLSRGEAGLGTRRVINDHEVLSSLASLISARKPDWQVVHFSPGGHSLAETMELFKQARLVIAMHGGANYNFIFAPPQTGILEIVTGPHANNCFRTSAGIGHDFWVLPLAGTGHYDPEIRLPVEKVLYTVEQMLQNQP